MHIIAADVHLACFFGQQFRQGSRRGRLGRAARAADQHAADAGVHRGKQQRLLQALLANQGAEGKWHAGEPGGRATSITRIDLPG